jgi:cobalt/nickel transport system permease protein
MHIPDGFLDLKTCVAADVLAVGTLTVALRGARRSLLPNRVPLLGLAAAFIFVGQMLNFPVAGGTSGHLVGSVLTAVLLGPDAAVIVLTAVLMVQCLVFADGGLLALGANIFNMGVVGTLAGYAVYKVVFRVIGGGLRAAVAAAAFASWCSTVLAAICCAGMLAASGTAKWPVVFTAMAGVHMIIGIGEAVITALVIAAVGQARPELIHQSPRASETGGYKRLIGYGLATSFGLALFLSPFASHLPGGLERVAQTTRFLETSSRAWSIPSPFANYTISGLPAPALATALAGVIGTGIVFILAITASHLLIPPTGERKSSPK